MGKRGGEENEKIVMDHSKEGACCFALIFNCASWWWSDLIRADVDGEGEGKLVVYTGPVQGESGSNGLCCLLGSRSLEGSLARAPSSYTTAGGLNYLELAAAATTRAWSGTSYYLKTRVTLAFDYHQLLSFVYSFSLVFNKVESW